LGGKHNVPDKNLDQEAKRLKAAARKAKTKSEEKMLEGFGKFYDALSDEKTKPVTPQPKKDL
jgi:hypothetical protein